MAGPLAGCLGTARQAVTQRCTRPGPSSPERVINREKVWGFYAQDSWKVTHRLTLNYGIRYEYTPFFTRRRRSPSNPPRPGQSLPGLPLMHQARSCFQLGHHC